MSIEVSCDCQMTYRLPDRFAGKRCRCRECGDSIRIPSLDDSGDPILQVKVGAETVDLGLSRNNILTASAPLDLTERIVLLRLRDELKSANAAKVSEQDIGNDWQLLQQVLLARRRKADENEARLTAMRTAAP